ncbi:uncharacterized protein LOC111076204 [Drosophila obscura]|uniref:uncharacterized protein LOC111076204 n=1 Tax=Drosophila obscura TaxID=7282 RepID=UPI000BA06B79|nr:uncharacterized protein LOC111076204 [Drosophila obscura]
MSAPRELRQRDKFRRSKSPLRRAEEDARDGSGRNSRVRSEKRLRVRLPAISSSAHGRTVGGRSEVGQKPPAEVGRNRNRPESELESVMVAWHRGGAQLVTSGTNKPRPKRRRRSDFRATADRRAAHRTPSTLDPGPGGSTPGSMCWACK